MEQFSFDCLAYGWLLNYYHFNRAIFRDNDLLDRRKFFALLHLDFIVILLSKKTLEKSGLRWNNKSTGKIVCQSFLTIRWYLSTFVCVWQLVDRNNWFRICHLTSKIVNEEIKTMWKVKKITNDNKTVPCCLK